MGNPSFILCSIKRFVAQVVWVTCLAKAMLACVSNTEWAVHNLKYPGTKKHLVTFTPLGIILQVCSTIRTVTEIFLPSSNGSLAR